MVRHVSRLEATARNAHYFSRRTPFNFFAAFFAPGYSQMDSPVALLRFVQADARKVVLSRREDTRSIKETRNAAGAAGVIVRPRRTRSRKAAEYS